MKKKLLPIVLLSLFGMVLTGCVNGSQKDDKKEDEQKEQETQTVAVTGVTLDKATASLETGETLQLNATVAPENATEKGLEWSSSAATIASVSASGLVSAVSEGQATITVKTKDGAKTATCVVTVSDPCVAVTGVSLDEEEASILEGETLQLNARVVPATATNQEIKWSSSDEDVASVSKTGLVTANGIGFATITAKTVDGNFTATCEVSVIREIESVSITNKSNFSELLVDDIESLSVETEPKSNIDELIVAGVLKAESSDPAKALVSGMTVTCLQAGEVTVTVSLFGKTDSVKFTIGDAVPGVVATVKEALDAGIVQAPFNGKTGKTSAITTTAYELTGQAIAVAPNGETGFNVILDDGTEAVYLQVNKASADPIPVEVGDFVKTTCKFTNYYGLLEGVSRAAATDKSASWIPAKDFEVLEASPFDAEWHPYLNAPVAMDGAAYNSYYDLCKTNGTKDAEGATYTDMKYVTIDAEYSKAFKDADKGGYKISDKYGLAPIGSFELDEPVDGQKSTLKAFLIGANTGKGKSNAIVVEQTPLAPTSVTIDQEAPILVKNNELQLTYTTVAAGSYSRTVEWTSSNEEVATVENGLVKALYSGEGSQTATITLKLAEGVEATTVVTVYGEERPATSATLNKTAMTLYLGRAGEQLTFTEIEPDPTSDVPVWSSSDETVATVDQKGNVTQLKAGSTTITAKFNDTLSVTCAVTVEEDPWWNTTIETEKVAAVTLPDSGDTAEDHTVIVRITEITSTKYGNGWAVDKDGTKVQLYGMYSRNGAARYDAMTNKPVAGDIVVLSGKFTKYNNGPEIKNAKVLQHNGELTTIPAVDSIALDKNELELTIGADATLKASYLPAEADAPTYVWKSSDETKATVANGKVTGVAATEAESPVTITVFIDANGNDTLDEGEKHAECAVTVSAAPAKVINMIEAPVVGTQYKMGMNQTNLGKKLYLTGAKDGNYAGVTENYDEGALFELVEVEGKANTYHVKVTKADNSVVYMNIAVSGKYVNVMFDETATTEWTWNTDYHTLVTEVTGCSTASKNGTNYVGTYNSNQTASPSALTYITSTNYEAASSGQYPIHFYLEAE